LNYEQFCFWLEGFIKLNGGIRPAQWRTIKDQLQITMKGVSDMQFVFPKVKKKSIRPFKAKLERLL